MAMKEAEDKLETHDKDIFRLKELVFVMCKNVDQLMGEMCEITLSRGKDRSLIMEGSHKKGFGTEVEEGESSQSKGGGDKGKYKWLEMPIFKGEHPDSWVYCTEHYFEIHELTDEEKIKVAIISFDHDFVDWYCWSNNRKPIRSWEELKQRMFVQFRSSREGSLTQRFLYIRQERSYVEYRKQFERYTAPIPKTSESVLEGTFINGLDPELKAKVESRNPIRLEEAMREAQAIDGEIQAIKEIKSGGTKSAKGDWKIQETEKTGPNENYRPNVTKIHYPTKSGLRDLIG